MSSFVIGDVHGCHKTLKRLLKVIGFRRGRDTLCFVGDLVNRGPRSLEVVRQVMGGSPDQDSVLGNHDLYLLALAEGFVQPQKKDTLSKFLRAEDCGDLLEWLRRRPLMKELEGHVIVHAGLLPQWSVADGWRLAAEVERRLRGPERSQFLRELFARPTPPWDRGDSSRRQAVAAAQVLTRLRTCRPDGRPCFEFTGPPEKAPSPCRPWYELRSGESTRFVFGHWAALGSRRLNQADALDSGCAWGGALTALRLDDSKLFQVENLDLEGDPSN